MNASAPSFIHGSVRKAETIEILENLLFCSPVAPVDSFYAQNKKALRNASRRDSEKFVEGMPANALAIKLSSLSVPLHGEPS